MKHPRSGENFANRYMRSGMKASTQKNSLKDWLAIWRYARSGQSVVYNTVGRGMIRSSMMGAVGSGVLGIGTIGFMVAFGVPVLSSLGFLAGVNGYLMCMALRKGVFGELRHVQAEMQQKEYRQKLVDIGVQSGVIKGEAPEPESRPKLALVQSKLSPEEIVALKKLFNDREIATLKQRRFDKLLCRLKDASQQEQTEIARDLAELIVDGINPNTQEASPLFSALLYQSVEVAKMLIACDQIDLNPRTPKGHTLEGFADYIKEQIGADEPTDKLDEIIGLIQAKRTESMEQPAAGQSNERALAV